MNEKRWYLYKSALTVPTQIVAMQDSRGMPYALATELAKEINKAFADNADLRRQVRDLEELLRREEARG